MAAEIGIIEVVARNVRRFRLSVGLSQEALADEAGLHRTYISQVERKQRNVTIVVLSKIAKALGIRPDQLLAPLPPEPRAGSSKRTFRHTARRSTPAA
jgi:transcriptional regulator with XRE-family HTH domain